MKDDRVYLEYILECLDRIAEYVSAGSDAFHDSSLLQDAVPRRLQTLSEATQQLADPLKTSHPGVPWREIAAFRNVVVHDYLGIDASRSWEIVEVDLPPLRQEIERILKGDRYRQP